MESNAPFLRQMLGADQLLDCLHQGEDSLIMVCYSLLEPCDVLCQFLVVQNGFPEFNEGPDYEYAHFNRTRSIENTGGHPVKKRRVKDMAASAHQRLLNKSRETGCPFNQLLQYYAMERFLYRLSKSAYADRFILKGALMLTVWKGPVSRPTCDMDILGEIDNDVAVIVQAVRDVCSTEVEPDGIKFNVDTIEAERIAEDADCEGVRVHFQGNLGNARMSMQFDVGSGDKVVPRATKIQYPTTIEMPSPALIGYTMESTIAEKFETMVKLGPLNSRMKDFFDIWLLSRLFEFNGETLVSAISSTFGARNTNISQYSSVFSAEFRADGTKATKWEAFLRRTAIESAPSQFSAVVEAISTFLGPPAEAVANGTAFSKSWKPGGPWQ